MQNVLLHFSETQRLHVIEMFHEALAEGGFFVMEQTQKLPVGANHIFESIVSNAQLYRKK
jgi:chemotaxis protein methyltransferase CheR